MSWPKPPTGTSIEAAWFRQLIEQCQRSEITSVEGFNIESTTAGRKLKQKYRPLIQPGQKTLVFYPFKLYQPSNIAVGQMVQMAPEATDGVTGTLVQAIVVAANPDGTSSTNLAANPPQLCITDTWRFWAVRWGYVEIRPNYPLPGGFITTLAGNFAAQIIPQYCDQIWEPDFPSDLDNSGKAASIIAIGSNPDQNGFISASFWIEVQQDTSSNEDAGNPTAIIRGWAFAPNISIDTPLFMQFGTYGNGDIPVGCINGFPDNGGVTAYNFIFDHARNRYPCGNGNWPASKGNGTVLNIRGNAKWDSGAGAGTCTPADLASQIFYPGDVINFYQNNSTAHTIAYFNQFVFTASSPALIAATFTDGKTPNLGTDANWTASFPVNLQSSPAP
jgi:hypothetical protein